MSPPRATCKTLDTGLAPAFRMARDATPRILIPAASTISRVWESGVRGSIQEVDIWPVKTSERSSAVIELSLFEGESFSKRKLKGGACQLPTASCRSPPINTTVSPSFLRGGGLPTVCKVGSCGG